MKNLSFPPDCPGYLMLFRKYVSRRASGKGRAVLEGVGLDTPTIAACYSAPENEEEAVQDGLTRWAEGKGFQPPTWKVIVEAVEYTEIAQEDIQSLKKAIKQPTSAFSEGMSSTLCLWHEEVLQLSSCTLAR